MALKLQSNPRVGHGKGRTSFGVVPRWASHNEFVVDTKALL